MSRPTPETIRIGERLGRIICVDSAAVEFADEAGLTRTLVLAACCRSPESRTVGLRGVLDAPPWFECFGPKPVRLVFSSVEALYQELLVPLGRMGWFTLDGC